MSHERAHITRSPRMKFSLSLRVTLGSFFLFLGACSTIANRGVYLSVDSEERGRPVYTEEGIEIGRTPLFHQISSQPLLIFRLSQNLEHQPAQWKCDYRWGISPLENLPLALAGASVAALPGAIIGLGGGLGIDLLSGSAFNCPEHLMLPPVEENADDVLTAPPRYCPRHILLTPDEFSLSSRQVVERRWITRVREAHPCARVINEEFAELWLHRLELKSEDFKGSTPERKSLARLGYETGASHVITFNLKRQQRQRPRLEARTFDLHLRRVVSHSNLPLSLQVIRELNRERDSSLPLARRLLRTIPETVALGFNERRFHQRGEDLLLQRNRRGPTATITSISHPDAFSTWAVDYQLGPQIGFDISEELPLAGESGLGDGDLKRFSRFSLGFLASFTTHTPLGAFSAGVGPGYGFYRIKQKDDPAQRHDGFEFLSGLQYTAFLTPSLLIRAYVDLYSPSMPDDQSKLLFVSDSGIVIGYYFEQLEPWVHSLF